MSKKCGSTSDGIITFIVIFLMIMLALPCAGAYKIAKGKPEEKIYGWIMLSAGLGLWAYVAYLSM